MEIGSIKEFKEYVLNNSYDESMFNKDGSINPNYNSFKKTLLIAKIFEDHWDEIYEANKDLIDKYRSNAYKDFSIDIHIIVLNVILK